MRSHQYLIISDHLFQHCTFPFWLRLYILSFVAIVPSLIYTLINGCVFAYLRASTRRLQPQKNSIFTNKTIAQRRKITRRELLLLRQMIFNFTMLIGGWCPIFLVTVIHSVRCVHPSIYHTAVLICQLSVMAVVLNLFKCNPPLTEYLSKQIQTCFSVNPRNAFVDRL